MRWMVMNEGGKWLGGDEMEWSDWGGLLWGYGVYVMFIRFETPHSNLRS